MPKKTKTLIYSDSSDDDLPSIPWLNNLTPTPRKKTFDELFKENSILIENQKKERSYFSEQIENIEIQDSSLNEETVEKLKIKKDDVLDELYEDDRFEKPSLQLFGELDYLQFFTWDDLTLLKCGFDSSLDYTEFEKLLITLNEDELQEEVKCINSFFLKKIQQLIPFIQYAFKSMSLHPDEEYVRACQKFINWVMHKQHIKNISISCTDIFMVLFNYGIDTSKELFNLLPESKTIGKSEIRNEIPKHWVFNLKAVLSSIGDLMNCYKMEEDYLYNIFIYLLWMSMDDFLKIKSSLQRCTAIILNRFSKGNWPIWRLKITLFVMSAEVKRSNQWNLILKMIRCISYETSRGVQLFSYISYLALRKLTHNPSDPNTTPDYTQKLFKVKNLLPILESISGVEKKLQLVAIKFIELFIWNFKLTSKEEHYKLCLSLKRCENTVSKCATRQQYCLSVIYSRMKTLNLCSSMKQMLDSVEEQEDISNEEGSNSSQSTLEEQSFNTESNENIDTVDDMLQKENIDLQNNVTSSLEAKEEISQDKNPKENSKRKHDALSFGPLKEQPKNIICNTGNKLLLDDAKALESKITGSLEEKKEKFQEKNPKENSEKRVDDPPLSPLNELIYKEQINEQHYYKQLQDGDNIALECTVSSAIPEPEIKSNDELEVISKGWNMKSDEETETSSESEDYESERNCERERIVTPSKLVSINHDHDYIKKEQATDSSIRPSKNLNTCFGKLAESNNQCENKSIHSAAHINTSSSASSLHIPDVKKSITENSEETRSNFMLGLENHTSTKNNINVESDNFLCTVKSKSSQIVIQNDSLKSEILLNPTSMKDLNSCAVSENLGDSVSNTNVISNIGHINSMTSSESIRPNEDIGLVIEKMITEIQSGSTQSKTLQNLIPIESLYSFSSSENSRNSLNNREAVSNIELSAAMIPSALDKSNEADNPEVFIDATSEKSLHPSLGSDVNSVNLHFVENNEKMDTSGNEKHENFSMPSIDNILNENRNCSINTSIKPVNKSVFGSNFSHDKSFIDHQNITVPSEQLPQAEVSSNIQPHSLKLPNKSCSSPKRKHGDRNSHLVSKRAKLLEKAFSGGWTVNFPGSSTPAEYLNTGKTANIGSATALAKNSSIYYTEICSSQLGNEIPAIRETSEVNVNHSGNTESIENQKQPESLNTKIDSSTSSCSKNLNNTDSDDSSDSDSRNSSDSDSRNSSKTSNSSGSSSESRQLCKLSCKNINGPNINKSSFLDNASNTVKDSQTVQSAVRDFIQSIPSGSDDDDDIQIIEEVSKVETNIKNESNNTIATLAEDDDDIQVIGEFSNIKTNFENESNNVLATHAKDKGLNYTSIYGTSPNFIQNFLKTPTKSTTQNQIVYYHLSDILPKKSVKSEPKTPKKLVKHKQRTPKKHVNPNLNSSPIKEPKLVQTTLIAMGSTSTSIPISSTKASTLPNQDDDLQGKDPDCYIIEDENLINLE